MADEKTFDVAIIGCGSAGLQALNKVRQAGKSVVIIDGGELGTTCARVGCMPSKAALQVAEDIHRASIFKRFGIENAESLKIDVSETMEYVRDIRDNFVDRVLSSTSDEFPEDMLIEQNAKFIAPNLLELEDGTKISASSIIIATGSRPFIPQSWSHFKEKIVTTDSFFELEELPQSIAILGLGVIGLEIGQAMSRLGVDVVGIDLKSSLGGLSDPEVNKQAIQIIGKEIPLWLGAEAELSLSDNEKVKVSVGEKSKEVDKVFASLGRVPNIDKLNLNALDVKLNNNGVPYFNRNTMQIDNLPIYMAGDVNADAPILHEASDEGRIAGYNAARDADVSFERKIPLHIIFSDPNIVVVGRKYESLDLTETAIGEVSIAPVGRALILGKNRGLIRVYANIKSGVLLGAELICVKGENIGHLLAWCIQENMTVGRMLQMPFYHPVMEEALQAALQNLYKKVEIKNDSPITELPLFKSSK